MTLPPLPDVPCLRVRLLYKAEGNVAFGSRFFLKYGGSAPAGADCTTLAGDIATAWAAHLAPLTTSDRYLEEVDVLDIATRSGDSGVWQGTESGTRSGEALENQIATNVEFTIARRYRGGKPRMYLMPGAHPDLADEATWLSSYTSAVDTGVGAFFGAIAALSVGSLGTLGHVNLHYYHLFTNTPTSSGRIYPRPNYTATATHDDITGYVCKQLLSSQRRRRNSLT